MKPIKLQRLDSSVKPRRVRRILRKLTPIFLVIAVLISFAVFLATFSGGSTVVNYIVHGTGLRSAGGRVNVLLLGIAGGTHDGANLTDTIMVASYDLKTNRAYLISIPRDLWLPSLQSKANAVYELGLAENNGLGFAKTIFGNVLGLPINYGLRLDFRGFIQAVDAVGGLDIDITTTFDDYNYPIDGKENDMCGYQEKEVDLSAEDAKRLAAPEGKTKVLIDPNGQIATPSASLTEDQGAKYFACRFEHLHFDAGKSHLDGVNALKYVRSRHGSNGEGSDFARSRRQQKVLETFRDKVLSFETWSNPTKISELLKAFGKSIDTDISIKDGIEFYKLSKKMARASALVLDDSVRTGLGNNKTTLLYHPAASDYGGAYVLISQDDDFSTIQQYVRKTLTEDANKNESTTAARSRDR